MRMIARTAAAIIVTPSGFHRRVLWSTDDGISSVAMGNASATMVPIREAILPARDHRMRKARCNVPRRARGIPTSQGGRARRSFRSRRTPHHRPRRPPTTASTPVCARLMGWHRSGPSAAGQHDRIRTNAEAMPRSAMALGSQQVRRKWPWRDRAAP